MAVTLTNYSKNCNAENGGVDEFIVYSICDRASYTVTNGAVATLVMSDGKKAYRWTPDMESATAGEITNRNRVNNARWTPQSAMIIFKDDDSETTDLVSNTANGFFGVIVKKSDPETPTYRHYGLVNGLTLETAEQVLGQLYEDLRGHTLNFVGKELAKAPTVPAEIVAQILIPAS